MQELVTWVNTAYAVYNNMRGQTGGAMSLGLGVLQGRSSKQKINAKSSTEGKMIGMSEYLPYNIWVSNFLKEQGYVLNENTLMQDNTNAIKLETNGRNSCTRNS